MDWRHSPHFRRGLRSAGWSSIDFIVLPLLWLATTPFFVASLGVDEYGIWMLANALVGFSGVATLGLGDATVRSVAMHAAAGDVPGVREIVRLTSGWCMSLGLVVGALLWVLSPTLAVDVFAVSEASRNSAVDALRMSALAVVVRMSDVAPTAVIQGLERFDLSAKIRIPVSILTMLVNVLLVGMGFPISTLVLSTSGVLALGCICKMIVVKRNLLPGVRFFSTRLLQFPDDLRSFAFSSWLQGLSGILFGQLDRLLVASLLGTRSLSYYSVCVQFSQQIHSLLAQTLSFLLPLASAQHERGASRSIKRIFFTATNLTTLAAVGMGIPVFLLSHEILDLWMGSVFARESAELLRMFVVVFTLLSTSIVPHYVMNATGYYRLNAILSCSGGIVAALFSLYMIPTFGLLGAAVSRLFTLPLSIAGRTLVHFKVLDDRRWFAALPVFLPITALFLLLAFLDRASFMNSMDLPSRLIAAVVCTAIGTGLVGFILFLINQDPEVGKERPSLRETVL